MTSGIEDAGFEIRDQLMWVFGSGFPKSHNIGKAIDKIEGNEREVVSKGSSGSKRNCMNTDFAGGEYDLTKGNSDWEGWGTALKPAHEPIVMGRKPFKGTVADNVLEWGTGGINVDGCRIGYSADDHVMKYDGYKNGEYKSEYTEGTSYTHGNQVQINPEGRFPANIIFDEEAGKILDEQSGNKTGQRGVVKGTEPSHSKKNAIYGDYSMVEGKFAKPMDVLGGASRFFYCPKASKKDRNEGCDKFEEKVSTQQFMGGSNNVMHSDGSVRKNAPILNKNSHPTVKPTDLMAYLIRLVTPKGGVVLDPFMGSGSTGKACVREGMNFIGIEREDEYMEIAKTRIEHEQKKNKHTQFFG
jgi:site-specific DNA-methyltransferase (adenine-specific)